MCMLLDMFLNEALHLCVPYDGNHYDIEKK